MRSVHELPQHEVGGSCIEQSTAQPVHAGAVATWQTPPQQVSFVPEQPIPQPLQFASSVSGSMQLPLQQSWLLLHTFPQLPQFIGSF